jgi:hypothetical protein
MNAAQNYFKQVCIGDHVVGTDFNFICETNHNRKSLVGCLIETFKGFPVDAELTAVEFFCMVETIIPNFPKSIVLEAAMCVKPVEVGSYGSTTKYLTGKLSIAVYFHIIFEEWIKMMEDFFREETTLNVVNIIKVKNQIKEFSITFPVSVSQPSLHCVMSSLDAASSDWSCGEISFDDFKACLFASDLIAADIINIVSSTLFKR